MKIIAIGDTHGKNTWERIVEKENDADVFVFIGDYFDSFDIPFETQMENFKKIIAFKKANMDRVILLIGNHDFHYIYNEQYSGYQSFHDHDIRFEIADAIEAGLMQMSYLWPISIFSHSKPYLFTHAGVTKTWLNRASLMANFVPRDISVGLNLIFQRHIDLFKFTPNSPFDNVGQSITQSPIWVRPESLATDAISGFIQVVGHTRQSHIKYYNGELPIPGLIMIDVLDSVDEYLIIKDGNAETGALAIT